MEDAVALPLRYCMWFTGLLFSWILVANGGVVQIEKAWSFGRIVVDDEYLGSSAYTLHV